MFSQHNVRATARDNTGQNTNKGHTPRPRIEIKIPDFTGNRTLTGGMEGRYSIVLATSNKCLIKVLNKAAEIF